MISILWQEFVRGGGIGKPPDSALIGARDSLQLVGTRQSLRSSTVVASPLVHIGILLLCVSGRIWRQGPCIKGYGDTKMEVAIPVGCRSTCTTSILDPDIQWRVGACTAEQWVAGEHADTWRCVVVHEFTPWSGRRCTIGYSSPRMDGGTGEHLGTSCLVESVVQWGYQ